MFCVKRNTIIGVLLPLVSILAGNYSELYRIVLQQCTQRHIFPISLFSVHSTTPAILDKTRNNLAGNLLKWASHLRCLNNIWEQSLILQLNERHAMKKKKKKKVHTVANLAGALTPQLVHVYLLCVHTSAMCAYYCLHPLILCLFTFSCIRNNHCSDGARH